MKDAILTALAGGPLYTDEVAAAIGQPLKLVGQTLSGMDGVKRTDVVDANTNRRMFTLWTLPDAGCSQDVGFNADCGDDAAMYVDGLPYCAEHGARVNALIALAAAEEE